MLWLNQARRIKEQQLFDSYLDYIIIPGVCRRYGIILNMIFDWFKSKDLFYEDIFKKLEEKDVKYFVVGGIAVALYGAMRLTADADIILQLTTENIHKFMMAMKELGYVPKVPVNPQDFADPAKRREWIEEKGMKVFAFWHPAKPLELVDVFVNNPIDFNEMEREKIIKKARNIKIPIPSLRHLVQLKKLSGRPEDLRDIELLERIHGKIG